MAHPIYGYTIQPKEVWKAVGRWLVENQNWKKAPEPDCFVFSGTVLASVGSILHTFAQPGDKVLTMVPVYAPLQKVVPASGCSLVQYHLPVNVERGTSRYEMDVEGLKKVLDKEKVKFIILCSPHNPVGRVWTREELVALAGACKDRGILVIVDEVWADLCWKPFTPFHPVAMEIGCKCISLGSPTKTWNLAGFHCSYAIFDDKEMLKRFKEYVEPQFLHHGSTFGTEALQIAYESREWMQAVRAYLEANFCYLEESLKDIPGIQLADHEATYLAWLDCSRLGLPSDTLHSWMMQEAGIVFSSGSEFHPDYGHFQRMNLACSRQKLREALERLKSAVLNK